MRNLFIRTFLSVLAIGLGVLGQGCAGTPKSTQLTTGDMDATAAVMAQKLNASPFLAERSPESPRVVIAINKVENLTSDLIPESEEWMMMQRVRSSLPIVDLGKRRNVAFVIPAEHLRGGRARGALPQGFAMERAPTHEMTATFQSGTRDKGKARTDAYLIEYRITDLASGTLVWDETFEFKRVAAGLAYD